MGAGCDQRPLAVLRVQRARLALDWLKIGSGRARPPPPLKVMAADLASPLQEATRYGGALAALVPQSPLEGMPGGPSSLAQAPATKDPKQTIPGSPVYSISSSSVHPSSGFHLRALSCWACCDDAFTRAPVAVPTDGRNVGAAEWGAAGA